MDKGFERRGRLGAINFPINSGEGFLFKCVLCFVLSCVRDWWTGLSLASLQLSKHSTSNAEKPSDYVKEQCFVSGVKWAFCIWKYLSFISILKTFHTFFYTEHNACQCLGLSYYFLVFSIQLVYFYVRGL